MSKGITMNCSVVEQDGHYEVGFNYEDTEGLNINREVASDDIEEALDDLITDVLEEYVDFLAKTEAEEEKESDEETEDDDVYVKQLEKIIEDLTAENNSLKADNEILQRRADDAVNNSQKDKDVDYDVDKILNGFDSLLKYYRKNPYLSKYLKFYY